jgi:excisionase family DNA binding protein
MITPNERCSRVAKLLAELVDLLNSTAPPSNASPSDAPATGPALLTKQTLAAALSTSTATIDRLVRDGRIPFVRLGDSRRFDLADVRAALDVERAERVAPRIERTDDAVRLLSRPRGVK